MHGARTDDAGEAENLAAAQIQIERRGLRARAHAGEREHRRESPQSRGVTGSSGTRPRIASTSTSPVIDVAAHEAGVAAVAQDRRAVGDAHDFFEPVRHEDDAVIGGAQTFEQREQTIGFARFERRRRFVEDQERGIDRERARDLDELLFGRVEVAHLAVRRRCSMPRRSSRSWASRRIATERTNAPRCGGRRSVPMMFSATVRSGHTW